MQIQIYISTRPLFRISPTRHYIILTNQVCQIGFIWINICSNPNIMNKIRIIITTLHRVSGDTITPSLWSTTLPTFSFIYFFSKTTNREKCDFENRMEALNEKKSRSLAWVRVTSSKHGRLTILSKFSNLKFLLYFFQVPQQEEEPMDLDRIMKNLIQSDNYFSQSLNMIEVRLSRLENIRMNKKTLSTQSLTIPDTSNHIEENQES